MATVIGRHSQPTQRNFLKPIKPRVVALMLIASLIGMLLATKVPPDGFVPWQVLIFGNLGIDLCAGAAAAASHVVNRRIDSTVVRTHKQPLVEGRASPSMVLDFVLFLVLTGTAALLALANPLTTWLTLVSLLGYAALYTGFLKRAMPQNIVIGGLAGAALPLPGWVAITGHLGAKPLLPVPIIFAWTPSHFRVPCIHRKDEYAKADTPVLPVTRGERYTKLHTLLYALVLFTASLMSFVIHISGLVHLLCALALDARFLDQARALCYGSRPYAAIKIFKYFTVYLFLPFMTLLVDHHPPLKLLLRSCSRALLAYDPG